MDFEVEELSAPLDSQVIVWKLELPSASKNVAKTEGAMRIYTTQRDFVGLAPLVMVSLLTASMSLLIITKSGDWQQSLQQCQHLDCILWALVHENIIKCTLLWFVPVWFAYTEGCFGLFSKWVLFWAECDLVLLTVSLLMSLLCCSALFWHALCGHPLRAAASCAAILVPRASYHATSIINPWYNLHY